jgi:5-methylcytosine-specific restriction endonuclease McrA
VCSSEKFGVEFPGPYGKTCTSCRKELARQSHRKYNAKRPPESEERKLQKARWFVDRKELWDAKLRRRRAMKLNADGFHTEVEWLALVEKHRHKCLSCKRDDVELTRDHVIPLSAGGTDYIENIQPLCRSCNSKKHVRIIDYRI